MTSHTTQQFHELLDKLPERVRRQAKLQYKLFCQNPSHSSLQFKKVHSRLPIYSVRVNKYYRTVGILEGDSIVWFWIGGHADYEGMLKRL
jgi:mRNA-degrading endonuclease RelE of RelBE toxin-antitoxin system